MKKSMIVAGLVAMTALTGSVFADAAAGAALYKKKGCAACHHETKDQLKQGLGPSIQQKSVAYKGNKAGLVEFLKGNGKAIVAPNDFSRMKPNLTVTKKMSDAELSDMADYILSK